MFAKSVYQDRRQGLAEKTETGLILLLGNDDSPVNYADNVYPFRQDSTFLYYYGLDAVGLAAVIDIDENRSWLYGQDPTVSSLVWTGPRPTVKQLAAKTGVRDAGDWTKLTEHVRDALSRGRRIHFLPPYRAETSLKLSALTGISTTYLKDYASVPLIRGVVSQRSVKSEAEINEIESALDTAGDIYDAILEMATPGAMEREIAAGIEEIAISRGSRTSFSTIATVHGETLHNLSYGNRLKKGQLLLVDSGVESTEHYSSDITRTFPVGGRFSDRQQAVYRIVLGAQACSVDAIRPNRRYLDIHMKSAEYIAQGLKDLGLMKGDVKAAVHKGAHGLFFPHGIGHMLGLDVHDMENLGEDRVGYDDTIRKSEQFGLASLRLAKPLKPGHVVTVEPGIYFIPKLIEKWKSEKKFSHFINYPEVEKYKKLGGIRIEDDVLVTKNGNRVLGKPIPKSVMDIESRMV
jgi:Xaa-Pro dipeptidase